MDHLDPKRDRLAACKEAIRHVIEPTVLKRVLMAALERRGFTSEEVDAGLAAVHDESPLFSKTFDHPILRHELELSFAPFEKSSSGDATLDEQTAADPRPRDATAKELRRLVDALATILKLQQPAGCARTIVEEQLAAAGFTNQERAWAIAAGQDYGLSDIGEFHVHPGIRAKDCRSLESSVMPADVLVRIVERYCRFIPYVARSMVFSTVRRMQAEKELCIPVPQRAGFAISVKDGKAANELAEHQWNEFYHRLCDQLRTRYPEQYQSLFT